MPDLFQSKNSSQGNEISFLQPNSLIRQNSKDFSFSMDLARFFWFQNFNQSFCLKLS